MAKGKEKVSRRISLAMAIRNPARENRKVRPKPVQAE
jgi:hypothetical protein